MLRLRPAGVRRRHWREEEWRLHRWTYARLTEEVDAQIGKVLEALRLNGLEETTLVVFASDHGEMDGAHGLVRKSWFYEESVNVPCIVRWKGVVPAGRVDRENLVAAGLDLLPTLCDFAGIQPPSGLQGRSLKPLVLGAKVEGWRREVCAEGLYGRMVRTARYKYSVHPRGARREQLFDLEQDPGEMTNLAGDAEHGPILEDHRRRLRTWMERTADRPGLELVSDGDFGDLPGKES